MASTYLTRTNGSAPTNTTKATVSCWVKKSGLAQHQGIFGVRNTGNNNINVQCGFFNSKWYMWYKDGSTDYYLQDSAAIPRDTNGWYHVVFRFDTTQGAAGDRLRVYVNGQDLGNSSFGTTSNPTSNDDIIIGTNGLEWSIGRYTFTGGSHQYFDGLISHFHYCDGYSYGPDSFGSTDATTGEWKINTAPSVTYGNNGFFVLKDSNSGTDQSGNTNNLTVGGGTLTKSEDNPSNIFATLNTLNQTNSNATFSHGNNTLTVSGNWLGATSTIGVFKGKWYFEAKTDGNNWGMGVAQIGQRFTRTTEISTANTGYFGKYNDTWSWYGNGGNAQKLTNDTASSWGSDFANGDIGMFALDADNGKIWMGKNGTWFESGDPANGTNAMYDSLDNSYGWLVGVFGENSTTQANFGNGYFGTTAVSSAGTNASGLGIFEYDVPSGFTAICTKGLNL